MRETITESMMSKHWKIGTKGLGTVVAEARRRGDGPPFVDMSINGPPGKRGRRYAWDDIENWLRENNLTYGSRPKPKPKQSLQQEHTARTIISLRAQARYLQGMIDERDSLILQMKKRPKGLLSLSAILHSAIEWESLCGVYFLIEEGEIIYIGQSGNIHARLGSHKSDGKKFTYFFYLLCEKERLTDLERAYISTYKPKLNGQYKNSIDSDLACPLAIGVGKLPW